MIKGYLEEIITHAIAEYPNEACGLVVGSNENGVKRVIEIIPCENIQDKLHKMDPTTYPQDSRRAYNLSPKKYNDVLESVKQKGLEIIGIYHSHPDHDSYFSEEDKKAATPFGEPSYPNQSQIVVSVYNGKFKEIKSFVYSKQNNDYLQEVIKHSIEMKGGMSENGENNILAE